MCESLNSTGKTSQKKKRRFVVLAHGTVLYFEKEVNQYDVKVFVI